MKRMGVFAGLTRVNPVYYEGWNGECPGCDIDLAFFTKSAKSAGVDVKRLFNRQATKEAFGGMSERQILSMERDDLFAWALSCHGTQVPDRNGDEADGLDEAVCLWNGLFIDDWFGAMIERAPAGGRILLITDSCTSGTVARSMPIRIAKAIPPKIKCGVIHMAGCAN